MRAFPRVSVEGSLRWHVLARWWLKTEPLWRSPRSPFRMRHPLTCIPPAPKLPPVGASFTRVGCTDLLVRDASQRAGRHRQPACDACRAVIDPIATTPRDSKLHQRLASLTDRIDGPTHGAILAAVHVLTFRPDASPALVPGYRPPARGSSGRRTERVVSRSTARNPVPDGPGDRL